MAGKRKTVVGEDHPRLRGEYPNNPKLSSQNQGSPPLARGILFFTFPPRLLMRITPACAGNTAGIDSNSNPPRDHPRLRGEYISDFFLHPYVIGSPPLARGILQTVQPQSTDDRITPACAGNTFCITSNIPCGRDHPRLRGEYLNLLQATARLIGSPPLARGILRITLP